MRPITVILVAITLLGAAGAAFVAKRAIEQGARTTAARQEELKRDIEVLVAAKDLPQGHRLAEAELRWDLWPKVTAEATKVTTREAGKPILAHLPATTLRRAVVAGEPLTAAAVFAPGKAGLMTGLIQPGHKALGIKVTPASAASGFVLPGDRVDVLLTVDMSRSRGGAAASARVVTETILRDVRVLGVDQEIAPGIGAAKSTTKKKEKKKADDEAKADGAPEEVAMVGKTVAVEVTAEQAQRLLTAQAAGTLSLALRSLAEGTEGDERGVPFSSDLDVSEALKANGTTNVRIIRGGAQ